MKAQIWVHDNIGPASWRTPNMTGNNGRSPIFPYIGTPFQEDFESIRDFHRLEKLKFVELMTTYKTLFF
jgi:hypothetical protein